MNVEHVPVQYVHVVWPDIAPMLERGLPYGHGEFSIDQALAQVASGQWELYVFTEGPSVHGAVVVQYFNRPNHRVAFVLAIGGRNIISRDTLAQLQAAVKRSGATQFECAARPSMVRLLRKIGLASKYEVLGAPL